MIVVKNIIACISIMIRHLMKCNVRSGIKVFCRGDGFTSFGNGKEIISSKGEKRTQLNLAEKEII